MPFFTFHMQLLSRPLEAAYHPSIHPFSYLIHVRDAAGLLGGLEPILDATG